MKTFTISIQVGNTLVADSRQEIVAKTKAEAIKIYKEQNPEYDYRRRSNLGKWEGIDRIYVWS